MLQAAIGKSEKPVRMPAHQLCEGVVIPRYYQRDQIAIAENCILQLFGGLVGGLGFLIGFAGRFHCFAMFFTHRLTGFTCFLAGHKVVAI